MEKRISILILLIFYTVTSFAQKKAITDTGAEVLLYDDGTWKYVNLVLENKALATNPNKFKKDKKASFLLKSSRASIGFYLDPELWSFSKAEANTDAEYELQLKGQDLYGMIISERIEIPLATLREMALENGRLAAPDLEVKKEEYRIVNGEKVLMLQLDGTMQGIEFSYFGYYFSCDGGTVQFVTYTSQNLLEEFRPIAENLLNGLVVLKEE